MRVAVAPSSPSRRRALGTLGAIAVAPWMGAFGARATSAETAGASYALRTGVASQGIAGAGYPATSVWAYNGVVPGPVLRVRQGERLTVQVTNDLAEETTVHWHGLRIPNAMDGVPHLTQPPIAAGGGRFDYAFACPDAGTFWYHPHLRGHVQVEMGLHGALIVEEPRALPVDRDVLWVLDDWRLTRDAAIAGGLRRDVRRRARRAHRQHGDHQRHASPTASRSTPGERIRLRLLNVANARIFSLRFEGHAPYVIALDGMPCVPHAPDGGRIAARSGHARRRDPRGHAAGGVERFA